MSGDSRGEPRTTDTSVRLELLTVSEYADFVEAQIAESARQRVRAGEWTPEDAESLARYELADLVGDRLRVGGHEFLKGLIADGTRVGWLWVAPAPDFIQGNREAIRWLSQITVEGGLRGRGFGRALLAALHRRLAEQGATELWLRVYDWNVAARRLYHGMGYQVVRQFETDAHMRVILPTPGTTV